jgi:hypothetical protein
MKEYNITPIQKQNLLKMWTNARCIRPHHIDCRECIYYYHRPSEEAPNGCPKSNIGPEPYRKYMIPMMKTWFTEDELFLELI